jgi:stage II sporulation protein D
MGYHAGGTHPGTSPGCHNISTPGLTCNNSAQQSVNRPSPSKSSLRHDGRAAILLLVFLAGISAACGHKAKVHPLPPPRSTTANPSSAPTAKPRPPVQPPERKDPLPARPADFPVPQIQPPASSSAGAPGPSIRIGLNTAAKELRISAPGEFYLLEKIPEAARMAVRGEIQVRLEHEEEEAAEFYRVQVSSLSRREGAETLERKLTAAFPQPVSVRENPDTGTFQVRIGKFTTRDEAQAFAEGPLLQSGYSGTIIVRESGVRTARGALRLALRGPDIFRVSTAGFIFQPLEPDKPLRLDGKAYRGWLDIALNRGGMITAVNQLGMEEYLPGVVPAEMSPSTYPETAALSAQAIAARTYALKNRGRFASDGFDLTADIRSQVYGGVAQERDMSSTAVRGTFGLALYYQGNLIDAMYSSTCGGRTEDFSSVFDSAPVPYLKSVACNIEAGGGAGSPETVLEGTHELDQPFFAEDGSVVNRSLELARVLGIASGGLNISEELAQMTAPADVKKWTAQALHISGRDASQKLPELDNADRAGIVRYFAENLTGPGEIPQRISASDAAYYLANLKDGAEVPEVSRRAAAYFLQSGLIHPYPDNTLRPLNPMKRADALALLARWLESAHPQVLRTGQAEAPGAPANSSDEKSLQIKWGSKSQKFPLARNARLFKISNGRNTSVDSLKIIGSEKLRFHIAGSGEIDFLEAELNLTGAASDRFSPQSTWKTTLARSMVNEKLRPLAGDIGEIRDLRPYRMGSSGRAVQIQAVGSRKNAVLNGYKVRNALGLKDTLFTIQRTEDPSGQVESFTFNGRGWGHGVGLCQVGAYGMARAGKSYEEILKTYYSGIELRRAY